MFPQCELVPSSHLRAVTKATSALASIKADPNVPARIETIARLAHARMDEYKLTLELQQSMGHGLDLTSSEKQAIKLVEYMVVKTKHYRDICLTAEKKEALQQEIDALEIVLRLAKEAL